MALTNLQKLDLVVREVKNIKSIMIDGWIRKTGDPKQPSLFQLGSDCLREIRNAKSIMISGYTSDGKSFPSLVELLNRQATPSRLHPDDLQAIVEAVRGTVNVNVTVSSDDTVPPPAEPPAV